MTRAAIILPLLLLAGCHVVTKEPEEDNTAPGLSLADMNEVQIAYAKANADMHKAMGNIPADADEAFIVGMIPHHQGAVDMAEIVLEHGKDAETRALAKTIIQAQKTEIAQMEAWLKKRGIDIAKPESAAGNVGADHSSMEH